MNAIIQKFELICLITLSSTLTLIGQRESVLLKDDWLFIKGNPPKASEIQTNESIWEKVQLPHDWAIVGPFIPKADGETGKLPWRGEGWYRKHYYVDSEKKSMNFYLLFDGVMASPKVYINGILAGEWDYGYNSFNIDITSFLKFGKDNVISVYADTRNHGSRWYPGAGIYRKVQLIMTDPVHVNLWGTHITTPIIKTASSDVRIINTICNDSKEEHEIKVENIILGPAGDELKRSFFIETFKPGEKKDIEQWMTLFRPEMWDINKPVLYSVKTLVYKDNKQCDESIEKFGFRTFEFTPSDGFHLNGRRVQIRGVCLHHDQGLLGAAFYPRAMERQLEIMKEMGCNAIRTSHNVPAPELLDLCDKMGFLVLDEIFDKYDNKIDLKPDVSFFDFAERNVRNFVLRDRNHPCIVLWSIGNEMTDIEQDNNGGFQKMEAMIQYFKKYDHSRPVTMVCHVPEAAKKRHFDYYDVISYNYGRRYQNAHDEDPLKPVLITESASTVSTRGFYELPLPKTKTDFTNSLQVSSYDLNAPSWAEIPDFDFMWQEKDQFCCGEFVWTGFDYLGEPAPYDDGIARGGKFKQEDVSRSSYFGIVDLCGIPKDRYYLYRSYWAPEKATTYILPHWNWEGHEGETIPVFVYTNGEKAELFLNGKSLGFQEKEPKSEDPVKRYRLRWNVPYAPGELKAVSYNQGISNGTYIVKTAGKPAKIILYPDRNNISSDKNDLVYIIASVVDENGVLCPKATNELHFTVEGAGELKAIGNGDPTSLELYSQKHIKAFYGKCLAIINSNGSSGKIVINAESEGLISFKADIMVK